MLNNLEEYNRKIRQDLLIEYRGLEFYTTWGLFSPRTIDDGSRLLLDHLELEPADDCLDLGCGYGVLGLCMARAAPQGRTERNAACPRMATATLLPSRDALADPGGTGHGR